MNFDILAPLTMVINRGNSMQVTEAIHIAINVVIIGLPFVGLAALYKWAVMKIEQKKKK